MPKGQAPPQDWSGHVSLNTQQCNFILECGKKQNKVERLREYGMLKHQPSRNPLRAEKTPRKNFYGFDYTPPVAKPAEEKWHYPDSDWGLMAKFSSQKQIYDDIIQTEKNYAIKLEECMRIKKKNEEMLARELDKQHHARELAEEKATQEMMASLGKVRPPTPKGPAKTSMHSAREGGGYSSREGYGTGRSGGYESGRTTGRGDDLDHGDGDRTGRGTGRSTGRSTGTSRGIERESATGRSPPKKQLQSLKSSNPADLTSHKITTMKELNSTHPEVLAQWRAQRAADFIAANSTTMDPTSIVPPRPVSGSAFKPAGLFDHTKNGLIVEKNEKKRAEQARARAKAAKEASAIASLDVASLSKELAKTEEQIAAQKLHIGLNTKTSGYMTGTNSKMMKNGGGSSRK